MPAVCDHEHLVDEEDQWGRPFIVCEDCGDEIEPEDTRDYEAIMEARAEEAFELRCRRET